MYVDHSNPSTVTVTDSGKLKVNSRGVTVVYIYIGEIVVKTVYKY